MNIWKLFQFLKQKLPLIQNLIKWIYEKIKANKGEKITKLIIYWVYWLDIDKFIGKICWWYSLQKN